MSEKRRDSKGRILRNGECQRKDGMYQYDYIDITGKTKCVYSWKLESTDPLPKGKRKCVSLRDKEREIQKELDARVMPFGGNLTVLELVKKYLLQKTGVRQSTKTGYKTVTNILEKEEFAYRRIDTIKLSDAKEWLIKLQQVDGRSHSSIHTIRGVVRPAFQLAVDDDLIRKNPFDFLTIDLEKKTLKIERQLIKSERKYTIEETKTESGKRVLPLQDEVCAVSDGTY